jgi:MFS family permease
MVRRNLVCHVLEGGFYMGGIAFVSVETVMPKIVESLGGAPLVSALMPGMLPAAFSIAGPFIAPYVERMTRMKPWVLTFGFLQRLPYLITGLVLLLAPHLGAPLLPLVVLTPVISGLIGGVGVVSWLEMVTRMIPENRRASGWAIRYVMQACIGIAAGPVIHWILTHRPGADGYALLHLIAFAFLALSYLSQVPMIEPPPSHPPLKSPVKLGAHLRALPRLLVSTPHLLKLAVTRFTGMGYLMLLGFMTQHALQKTGRNEADMGFFVTAAFAGTIVGSLLAGWWGNRRGGKELLLASRMVCVVVSVWALLAATLPAFMLAFFIVCIGLFLDRVGDLTLAAELCPVERRSTLQSVLGFCNAAAYLLATLIGGLIFTSTRSFAVVALTAASFAVVSIFILRRIPEPRHATLAESVYCGAPADEK